jgi:hypothetical protein
MEMQGLSSMATKPIDHTKEILEDRKRRRLELQTEMKTLSKHKKRIKFRLVEGRDWPITNTGDKADIDHDDVMAPLPEDMKAHLGDVDEKMQALRLEADQHESFAGAVVPIDEGVLLRRRAEREQERTATEAVRGEKWTPELVEARMEEAYRTLFRSSISGVRPREFGNAMPEIVREVSDLVHQAGNKSLRNAIAHRFKGVPSTEEVRRAEDALGWAMDYLNDHDPDLAGFLNLGAMWRAWGAKITKKCADIGVQRQTFYRDRKEAVQLIVEGLIKDGKAPT